MLAAPDLVVAAQSWSKAFGSGQWPKVSALLRIRQLPDGQAVFLAGDPPDGLYGVLAGQVRLVTRFAAGQHLLNHVARPGDWFGEISTLDVRPRFNDAICAGPVKVAWLSQRHADALMQEDAAFVRALSSLATRRHRSAVAFAGRVLTQPMDAQIAYALLSLTRRTPAEGAPNLALRQEDLAAMVGVSRQTVARHLRRLSDKGILILGYRTIAVRDRIALQTMAGRQLSTP